MTRPGFRPFLTTVVAVLAGAVLFAVACRGLWALTVHILRADAVSAVSVGALSLAALVLSLVFTMPSALRHVVALGGTPGYGGPVRFGAGVVLLAILLACVGADRQSAGPLVLGLLPRGAYYAILLTYSVLYVGVFIFPGFAYPAPRRDGPPAVPSPKPRIVPGLDHIRAPWLRRAIRSVTVLHLVLWGGAVYAIQFADVLPAPGIVTANRTYLALTTLLSLLPLGVLLAAQPISDGASLMDHVRAKGLAILGLVLANGAACVVLPERGLPLLANVVLEARPVVRSHAVVSAKPKSGLRGCGAKVVILLHPDTGRTYDLCRVPTEIAERASAGDMLDVIGTSAGFGMTIEGFRLRPVGADASVTDGSGETQKP